MGYCDDEPNDSTKCNKESFSKPMPWIGIYIASASLICSLAMAADLVRGFRSRKLWFPCKYFTLNAASLTVLAVAIKLPMDLNNPMPGTFDQLSKLSSLIFMATSTANLMPSLGDMNGKDVFMNMAALGILLITLLVNVSIQLGTGLIYSFTWEHFLAVFLTLTLFWMMGCSALVVPTTKRILERKYHEISNMISDESLEGGGEFGIEKLNEQVRKYWLMAESSNPQFVMVRSPICFLSSAISCLGAIVLFQAFVQSFFGSVYWVSYDYNDDIKVIDSFSDYSSTTYAIVWIQSAGVVVGTLAPLFRFFIAIKLRYSSSGGVFRPEKYWTERLMEWKEKPLGLQIGGPYLIKAINKSKNMVLWVCAQVQIVTVLFCKSVQLFCIGLVWLPSLCFPGPKNGSQDQDVSSLSCYVLHLEGEDELPRVMVENKNPHKCINRQPEYLVNLLKKMNANFYGVAKFDSNRVHSLHSLEPPNCWKLPVITLTTIAISLPHISTKSVEDLVCGVSQGLKYVSIVDEVLADTGEESIKKVRETADVTWSEVNLSGRFLNKDLRQMSCQVNTSREILAKLGYIARDYVKEIGSSLGNDCSRWPIKAIAANSVYRISQSVLLELESYGEPSNEEMFGHISVMIADILGSCLTNLPKAITTKCSSISIEKREDTVQDMARIIGETEEILKMIQEHQLPDLAPKQRIDIDKWRSLGVGGMSPLVSSSFSTS